MACRIPDHHVVVALKPGTKGAYASCVDEPEWLADWAVERLLEGATLQRVHCDRGHDLMKEYQAWCDEEDKKKAVLQQTQQWVDDHRRKSLAKPIPRNECPGCFSIIYDGAAEQGWCTNCWPHRQRYAAEDIRKEKP